MPTVKTTNGQQATINNIAKSLLPLAVDIKKLKLDPKNARVHGELSIAGIKDSMLRFGQTKCIVVRKDTMTVVAGNGTLEAAKALGWTKVAANVMDMDDVTAASYGLADNRVAELSTWDPATVAALETLIIEAGGEMIGWSDSDLMAMRAKAFKPEDDPDAEVTPPTNPLSKPGDLWRLGKHRLICGDATDPKVVAKVLAGAVPLLMVTDPPYGVDYNPEWRLDAGLNKPWQTRAEGTVSNDARVDWSDAYKLFPGDVAYVWHAGKYAGQVQDSLTKIEFDIRSQIIWKKKVLVISRGHYHWQHEPLWYAVRIGGTAKWSGDRKQSTIWEIENMHRTQGNVDDGKNEHGTQKPIECMARPIRNHGKAGDKVYDPFVGSGTTIIASHQLGRVCYAVELDPKYVDVCLTRYAKVTGEDPVREDGKKWSALATKKPAGR